MIGHAIQILLRLADKRRLTIILGLSAFAAITEGVGFVLLVPLLGAIVDTSAQSAFSPVQDGLAALGWQPGLAEILAIFAGLIILRAAAEYARTILSLKQNIAIVDGLRQRAFAALLGADWRTLSRMRQSDNRALLISEVDRSAVALDQLAGLVRLVIGILAIGLAALTISPIVALAGFVAGGLVFALYGSLRRRARGLGQAMGEKYRVIYGRLEENLDAARVVKSFGKERFAEEQMIEGFQSLRRVRLRFAIDNARARGMLQACAALLVAILVWLAFEVWSYPALLVLPLVALFARALPQLGALLDAWQMWSHTAPAVIAADTLIREAEGAAEITGLVAAHPPQFTREIAFENVGLSHREDAATLQSVSLSISAGEFVALVGPSGAGKSTLADIAGGLLSPDQGEVLIDGVALDPALRQSWRRRVAYVDQQPILFHGTIRENLTWADAEASEAALERALQQASAGFVADLPGGLDCHVGEGGRQLSGGERQRIVLARALLRDPALLILDEATSALDSNADQSVARAVADLRGTLTILAIGHRGALTDLAPRKVTLVNGRIASDESVR
ncbi:ABC transporter ATP-binding protein [Parerythrobacter jejuensis]|uniref:ATP-binding cassette domain-containing protein n=1 Tax=Parerythrobacter jejuensis TaxID=795812 RepID=A0A845AX80_9SPHN|nr:ABC transporter ATP-binding protein [Parerythrobacter jejuensis]MXP31033.1 ATP-binding cassette domain-containing protein [Parerythrobacter jejuensis]MXP33793.1 ATP-binding cassette domain-containing protein [Parerythrobacter jejuensis]